MLSLVLPKRGCLPLTWCISITCRLRGLAFCLFMKACIMAILGGGGEGESVGFKNLMRDVWAVEASRGLTWGLVFRFEGRVWSVVLASVPWAFIAKDSVEPQKLDPFGRLAQETFWECLSQVIDKSPRIMVRFGDIFNYYYALRFSVTPRFGPRIESNWALLLCNRILKT